MSDERFWAKVDRSGECWLWAASLFANGYGQFRLQGKNRLAHRVAYELLVGPIPEGLHLDHLCRVRHCVNPDHLEPVTPAENYRRGLGAGPMVARQLVKTHCPQGHPYDVANTYRTRGRRHCRACHRAASAARRQRAKAVAA